MKIRLIDCHGQVLETLACLKTTTSMWLNCLAESSIQKSISLSLFHRRGTAEIELSVFEGLKNIKVWVVERWRIFPPWCYSAKPRLILISDFPAEYHTLPYSQYHTLSYCSPSGYRTLPYSEYHLTDITPDPSAYQLSSVHSSFQSVDGLYYNLGFESTPLRDQLFSANIPLTLDSNLWGWYLHNCHHCPSDFWRHLAI